MNKPDNPPFFPNPELGKHHFDDIVAHQGATLRDWFAGQALAGLLANPNSMASNAKYGLTAYSLADAMLAARASTEGGKYFHNENRD